MIEQINNNIIDKRFSSVFNTLLLNAWNVNPQKLRGMCYRIRFETEMSIHKKQEVCLDIM